MSDDLLRRLAERARQRDDHRWDERTPGPLTDAEARALGAAEAGAEGAFEPPSEDLVHRMITAAQEAMATPAMPSAEAPPARLEPGPANLPPRPQTGGMTRRWPVWMAGVLVAAAALLTLRPAPPVWRIDEAVGTATQRSADPALLTLSPGGRLQLTLQPDAPTSARVEVRVVLHTEGAASPLPVEVERSPAGSLRLQAVLPAPLPAASGEVRVDLSTGWTGGQELRLPWKAGP